MPNWPELTGEMERLLRLQTYPVAYKRFDDIKKTGGIRNIRWLERNATFCQVPTLVRRGGWTVGVKAENIRARCARINGLAETTDEEIRRETDHLSTTWFADKEVAAQQLKEYPLMPPGEAVVLAPLAFGKFDPDMILVYGNPAQLMLLMNGLQFKHYERYQFFFIGEGACADGLAQSNKTGKPALAIPCFGERRFGGVADDEIVIALPPDMMEQAVEGLKALWERGLRYPIMFYGPECDPSQTLTRIYPEDVTRKQWEGENDQL